MFADFSVSKIIFKIFVSSAGLLLLCCTKTEPSKNFILITLDTQRADYISAYDPSHADTPNIDFLAQTGTLYKNCFTHIPITLPSHASIFFSL